MINTTERLSPAFLPIPALEGYEEAGGRLQPIWGDHTTLYSIATGEILAPDEAEWAYIHAHEDNTGSTSLAEADADALERLRKDNILVPADGSVTVTLPQPQSGHLETYLQVTQACNLACSGCATGTDQQDAFGIVPRTMSAEELESTLTTVFDTAAQRDSNTLTIKYAGGEPMMPVPFRRVAEVQTHVDSLRKMHPSIAVRQVLLTNGAWITEEKAVYLAKREFHTSVSLWGLGEGNDAQRNAHDGTTTRVYAGLKRLHDAGASFNIHHVVTPENAAGFADFIRALWDTNADSFLGRDWTWENDPRFIPLGISLFRPQTRDQLDQLLDGGYETMVQAIRSGFAVMKELIDRGLPIQPLTRFDYLSLFSRPTPMICGSGHNYLAIGPDNRAAACHQLLPSAGSREEITVNTLGEVNHDAHELIMAHRAPDVTFPNTIPLNVASVLRLHAGMGCPLSAQLEHKGEGIAAATAEHVYAPLLMELIALESARRLATLDTPTRN